MYSAPRVIGIAFYILIGSPLKVGSLRYFKQSAEGEVRMGNIGYAFNKERYWAIVLTMLWSGFLNFLWFLLLIIPGIIKSYAYSQVPYILAGNPNIGYKRAVELSRQMTHGHKFNMFVLDLSFIGWILLGLLALGISIVSAIHSYQNEAAIALGFKCCSSSTILDSSSLALS
ncbi:DUF975 family protein [Paenibacillus sp. 22594]|uniref:DUF975 family protein n=1 Tax=Paenibacillus sp. 22594 TaxID=3453947 RepID=UPI003F87ECF2